ncbi:MAG: penicillin-binding protein 2 [Nitrospirae bacterium]|nr:penicillin-binding protein 2 [Nitrospirota bacterium]
MTSSPQDDFQDLYDRITWGVVLILLLMGLLVVRAWSLQVVAGQTYRELADNNRVRMVSVLPQRGLMYDRRGRLLVNNTPGFTLYLVLEDAPKPLDPLIERLAPYLEMSEEDIRDRVKNHRVGGPFTPIPIKSHLKLKEVALIESHRPDFPGVKIEVEAQRNYPYGAWASHLLGYVSDVSAAQHGSEEFSTLPPGMQVGQYGAELAYDAVLRGQPGEKGVEVDALGHERRVVRQTPPVRGDDVVLTIDADVQREAEEALRDKAGVVVALDPTTGEVIALVSHPDFDPNVLSVGLTVSRWAELLADPGRPLNNRAIQGQYPPGSTFKIVVATAALERKAITPDWRTTCLGGKFFGNRRFRDWKAGGHGIIDLHRAIVESCDVYFYEVGNQIGVDAIAEFAKAYGLGEPTGIQLSSEKKGVVPSTAWKLAARHEPWYPGETLSVSIGQGYVNVTPLQMAMMIGTVAMGGERHRPRYVRSIRQRDGSMVDPEPESPLDPMHVSAQTFALLRQALRGVVVEPGGTASAARSTMTEVAGKTGTAQVVGMPQAGRGIPVKNLQDHAWFVAFAPVESPRIAVAVLVEHGGHGGSAAAPIAKRVIEKYLAADSGAASPAGTSSAAL